MPPVFKRILVPLDDSELSDKVLDTALNTAAWSGAAMVLLRVQSHGASLDPRETETDLRAIDAEMRSMLQAARERAGAAAVPPDRVQAEVRAGPLVQTIVDTTQELMADCVVMGMHGRSGLSEQFTGSTTEQVVAKAPATVFVVRPDGWPFLRN